MLARLIWYWQTIAWEPSMMLQLAVFSACMLILFYQYQPSPGKKWTWRWLPWFFTEYTALLVGGLVYHAFTGDGTFANVVVHALFVALSARFLAKNSLRARAVMGIVFYTTEMCLVTLAGVFGHLMGFWPLPEFWSNFFRNSFIVLTLLIAAFLRWYNIEKQGIIARSTVYLIAGYNIIFLILVIVNDFFNNAFNNYGYIFCGVALFCFLGASLLGYGMACRICHEYAVAIDLQAKAVKSAGEAAQLKVSEAHLVEMRKLRHDLKNHYGYMRFLIRQKNYEELDQYFGELESDLQSVSMVDCGNSTVSAVLNLELAKASAAGVSLETKLAVPPMLPFRDSDICSLLANLIDNAIESCSRMSLAGAVVEVGVCQRQEYLYITVANPIGEADQGELLSLKTAKNDQLAHGYGSKIVNEIVQTYNGAISRSVENQKFLVNLMLDLRYTQAGRRSP